MIRVVIAALMLTGLSAAQATSASAKMDSTVPLKPGSKFTVNIQLNEPLPPGAYFQVRFSPIKHDSELPVNSGEPATSDRKSFKIPVQLPETAMGGKWHIQVIYLFLAGASWTGNTIATNDLTFDVAGPEYPIPTKADASISH